MKKYILIATTAILLAGCFNKTNETIEQQPAKNEQTAKSTNNEQVTNKDTIQISIPIEQYEELSTEEITEVLREEGAQNIQFTEENTVKYNVPKQQFNKQKEKLQNELKIMISSINEKKQYPTIQSVQARKDYTSYELIVDKEKFENSFDSLAVLSLVTSTLYYFSYIGDTKSTITVNYIDIKTQKKYKSLNYPE